MKRVPALAAIVLFAVATGAANGQTSGDSAAVAKVRSAFEQAVAAQDAAAIAKLFAPDGVEMPPNAPAAKGRAAIEAYHKAFAQQFMVHGMTITATDTKVTGDTAYDVGGYKQSLMPMGTSGMVDDKGKYVVLLKKTGGSWAIVYAIYNSDAPPPAPKK